MYLKKKELLEWIEREQTNLDWSPPLRLGFLQTKKKIQSGAFDAPEHPVIQSIRDFMPMPEHQAGYDALVAWLESTTSFVLEPPKCETCEGKGQVFQDSGAAGDVGWLDCPDCDGKGYNE